jgi:outer membrane protein
VLLIFLPRFSAGLDAGGEPAAPARPSRGSDNSRENNMSFMRFAVPVVLSCGILPAAQAADPSWLVRARAVYIATDVQTHPDIDADVDNKLIPEIDISYFLTRNLALELILTVPQQHDVTVGGERIGSVKHLPPTLTMQYRWPLSRTLQPYVGAGLNYTRFSDVRLADGALDIDRDSFGAALQIGADFPLSARMVLNLDVKKVWISTDVHDVASGAKITTLDIDPWLFGIGLGWSF